jgi:hypothetical protein
VQLCKLFSEFNGLTTTERAFRTCFESGFFLYFKISGILSFAEDLKF